MCARHFRGRATDTPGAGPTLLQFARYFPIFSGNSGISKEADVRWFGEYDLTQVHVHLAACDQRVDHVWFHNTVNLHHEIQQGYSWLCFDYLLTAALTGPAVLSESYRR